MKTNVRNEDAIARAMGWLEQLRGDGRAEPVSEGGGEPAAVGGPPPDATAPGRRTQTAAGMSWAKALR